MTDEVASSRQKGRSGFDREPAVFAPTSRPSRFSVSHDR